MASARTLTWLHLSDVHFKADEHWEQSIVLNALKRDVLSALESSGLLPDIVFVTGDIAHSGAREEYAQAHRFFEEVARITRTDPHTQWFLVPGNHDVSRSLVKSFAKQSALGLQHGSDVSDILRDADCRRLFTVRQRDFFQFTSEFLGPSRAWTDEEPWKVEVRTLHELKLAVLGLNSAWASEGGNEDQGRILLGEYQVHKALLDAEGHGPDLKIALVHHPLDWLRGFDQERVKARLLGPGGAHFLLRGHLHMGQLSRQTTPDAQCIEFAAGACWQDAKYPHGVMAVRVDVEAGLGEAHLWRYSSEGRGFWKRDNFLYENLHEGQWSFPLPEQWGFGPRISSPLPNTSQQTAGVNLQIVWDRASYRHGADVCRALVSLSLDPQALASRNEHEPRPIRTPVHHLLVLDVSGSMDRSDKYPVLLEAVDLYLRIVSDDDLVTLIPFSSESDALVSAMPVGHVRARYPSIGALLTSWPHRLRGTSMAPGLERALSHAIGARRRGFAGVERLSCLTDGHIHDYLACQLIARHLRELGAGMSVFGFGADFDAAGAEALVEAVGGTVRYVPTGGHELQEYFGHMARTSQRIVLRNAELSIEVAPNVTCFDVFACRPHERHVGNFADQPSPVVTQHFGAMEYSKTYILLVELRSWQKLSEVGKVHFSAEGPNGQIHVSQSLRPVFDAHSAPQDPLVRTMAVSLGALVRDDRETQIAALKARIVLYKREGRPPQHVASLERQLAVLQRGGSVQELSEDDLHFARADAATRTGMGS
ncbi:metallophosphoesterase [Archangium gephyra]|uniref:metallophosphoesterase n=1 Tax=Archangium gephyra TaxID=48 RepID=UPI003B7E9529